jgi:hypothetical protein
MYDLIVVCKRKSEIEQVQKSLRFSLECNLG